MLDRVLNLLLVQTHAVHDLAGDSDFVLGNTAVDLGDMAHDLERRLEKQPADFAHGSAARTALALIPLMPEEHADQRADGPEEGSDEPTNPFAEPLHPLSELSKSLGCRDALRGLIIVPLNDQATRHHFGRIVI